MAAGEELVVEIFKIESPFDGWCIAHRKDNEKERGLVPVTFLDLQRHPSPVSIPRHPSQSMNGAPSSWHDNVDVTSGEQAWPIRPDEESDAKVESSLNSGPQHYTAIVGRELNRFSSFVITGIEDYLLKDGPGPKLSRQLQSSDSAACENETFYIDDGPTWHAKIRPFEVAITGAHTMAANTKSPFVAFEIETVFPEEGAATTILVERRYSQFAALHKALVKTFPVLVLPNLPPKTLATKVDPSFIQVRQRELQHYMQRLIRHPLIRGSDLMTTFLASEDCQSLEESCSHRTDESHYCFYDEVLHPDWNHDCGEASHVQSIASGINATAERFHDLSRSLRGIFLNLNAMQQKMRVLAADLGNICRDTQIAADCLSVESDGILDVAWQLKRASQDPCYRLSLDCENVLSRLEDWRHICKMSQSMIDIHKTTMTKLEMISQSKEETEILEARCDTVLNVILAELNLIELQRKEDVQTISRHIREFFVTYHELSLIALQSEVPKTSSLASRRALVEEILEVRPPAEVAPSFLCTGVAAAKDVLHLVHSLMMKDP